MQRTQEEYAAESSAHPHLSMTCPPFFLSHYSNIVRSKIRIVRYTSLHKSSQKSQVVGLEFAYPYLSRFNSIPSVFLDSAKHNGRHSEGTQTKFAELYAIHTVSELKASPLGIENNEGPFYFGSYSKPMMH